MLNVKIKKLSESAVIPQYAKHGDAGLDLTAISKEYDDHGNVCYGTGLAFEVPHGYVSLLFPRSSNTKKDLILGNSVGVVDSGYRGEVVFKFKPTASFETTDGEYFGNGLPEEWLENTYDIGERIGQIVILPHPKINFVEVQDLSTTERGVGGFGSTDPITAAIEANSQC